MGPQPSGVAFGQHVVQGISQLGASQGQRPAAGSAGSRAKRVTTTSAAPRITSRIQSRG